MLRGDEGATFTKLLLVVETAAGQSVSVARVTRRQRGPLVGWGLAPLWLLPPWVVAGARQYLVCGQASVSGGGGKASEGGV